MKLLITCFSAFLLSATLYSQNDYSMSFDGVDDYVEVLNNSSFVLSDFSVSFSIKTSSFSGAIIQKDANPEPVGGDWNIAMWDGLITVNVRKENGSESGYAILGSSSSINDDTWHSVCVKRNAVTGLVHLFIDGDLEDSDYGPLGQIFNDMDINFGRQNYNFTDYFQGKLDDISIWNEELADNVVNELSNCAPNGNEEGLIGYWNFDEGSGTTAFDQTANGNDGTINGATYSIDVPEQNCQSGCTDALANNFNPEATLDDGTCCYLTIAQNDTTICEGESISLNVIGDLQNGLVAYYPFNGNANDESGNGNHGTVNEATLTSDRFGNSSSAYTFGGDGDYINIGNDESLNRENISFSINTWINFNNYLSTSFPNQSAAIISNRPSANNYGTLFALVHDGKLDLGTGGVMETALTPALLSTNQWYNVCVTHDNTTHITSFYIDGALVYSTTSYDNSVVNVASGDHYIGKETHENLYPFDGEIDDMYLYNRVLTLEEVQELYNDSSGLFSEIIWSTGDTTATITVTPTQTTTYWVERTENGVTCTDEVTITVQSTGCGNSDACNFTEGDACDIDCVFANDCESLASLCGEGTVWDSETHECIVANPTDTNLDGCTDLNDLMDILAAYGDCAAPEFTCGDPLEYQGYNYETVLIGDQCWFAENLRAENYRNGEEIAFGDNSEAWINPQEGCAIAFGGYDAPYCQDFSPTIDACNPLISVNYFGLLYNHLAVTDARRLCPISWKVPADSDWISLELFLGMSEDVVGDVGFRGTTEGQTIKTTLGWQNNGDGTDLVGFSGQPSGGISFESGGFGNGGSDANWWTSTEVGDEAWRRNLNDYNNGIRRTTLNRSAGMSVRCIKD